eukprot:COSAG02_NODE_28741_length_583_cov_1.334711_2_plen_46_part_01
MFEVYGSSAIGLRGSVDPVDDGVEGMADALAALTEYSTSGVAAVLQ